jgi:hypothetical protein
VIVKENRVGDNNFKIVVENFRYGLGVVVMNLNEFIRCRKLSSRIIIRFEWLIDDDAV